MRNFIFALAFILPMAAQAETKKKIDLRPQNQKVEDPGSATPLLFKTPAQTAPTAKDTNSIKITGSCKDLHGMIVKSSDPSYATCLKNQGKLKPEKVDENNPNSVGITIGN